MTDDLWNQCRENKIHIGNVIRDYLFANLPGSHQGLVYKLSGITHANQKVQDLISKEEDVKACRPYSDALIPYAVTPIRIIEAINATGNLLKRAQRRNILPPDQPICLSYQGAASEDGPTQVSREELIRHIHEATMLVEEVAQAVFEWMIDITPSRPYLIHGYRAEKLILHSMARLDLTDRLSRSY